jgi:predicted RNA binding protein YcfA (HicA-like mRNA interferase family)
MAILPAVSAREVVKIFQADGWRIARQRGSHTILVKDGRIAMLSVPPSNSSLIGRKQASESAREKIKRLDDARSLVRQLFRTEINLFHKTLTVRLHPTSIRAHDEIVRHICQELISTETVFPGTDLCLICEISGSPLIPRDLDV